MAKLKTLKDVDFDIMYYFGKDRFTDTDEQVNTLTKLLKNELRNEAIKHYKDLLKDKSKILDNLDSGTHKGDWTLDDVRLAEINGKMRWIRLFFDLKKEDLK